MSKLSRRERSALLLLLLIIVVTIAVNYRRSAPAAAPSTAITPVDTILRQPLEQADTVMQPSPTPKHAKKSKKTKPNPPSRNHLQDPF